MLHKIPHFSSNGFDDVVIVGGGLAGLFCALKLRPMPVTVLSPTPIGQGGASAWAQGGIAAAISPGDSVERHLADTISAGAGLVEERIARLMTGEGAERIHDLLSYGVPFDKDLEGKLKLSHEAAHSKRRIVRVNGDMAGAAIMRALTQIVQDSPSIRVLEGYVGEQLCMEDNRISGILAQDLRGGLTDRLLLPARAVVLSSGGIGGLYAVTTNPPQSLGEGLAMAARAGAVLADLEFVQFHPTALNINKDPAPLATEALRGEGAYLVDKKGRRFMLEVHEDGELAPRDIVARAIHARLQAGQGAWLDARQSVGARFPALFPTVYQACIDAGIDPVKEPIPVAPAAHYHMGGVHVDVNGRTSIDGLWACGEVASTGAHGANRLASNSLLEAVVFSNHVAEDIQGLLPSAHRVSLDAKSQNTFHGENSLDCARLQKLRHVMSAHVGVLRDEAGLKAALKAFGELAQPPISKRLANMLLAAQAIALAALARRESRGCHMRLDYPKEDPAWQKRSFIKNSALNEIASSALAG